MSNGQVQPERGRASTDSLPAAIRRRINPTCNTAGWDFIFSTPFTTKRDAPDFGERINNRMESTMGGFVKIKILNAGIQLLLAWLHHNFI
ncbi:hypothetical protein Zmor_009167 [Zophobas morio]|uniref:Uncharacterized protein n=1 Tax=Zophobas morio TaxID=2755281 RepID=A0AA38INU0_9CUCU|nr:hypothetical protein Zmor_009167 [Zophobas morio]